MKRITLKTTMYLVASGVISLASTQALASPRLCGYIAVSTPNKIGILSEFSDNDSLYHKKCDEAIDKSWNKIQGDSTLKTFTWTKIFRNKCYDVAKQGFLNPGDNADLLCNNMNSDNGYKITKKGSAATVFEKQPNSNSGGVSGVANDIDNGINKGTKGAKDLGKKIGL